MNNSKASANPKADSTNAAAATAVSTDPGSAPHAPIRHLVLVLGDQLDISATALDGFDPAQDLLWMAEVAQESEHVWSAKQRTTVFLSAMRHFADALRAQGWPLRYVTLDAPDNSGTLAAELAKAIAVFQPQSLVMTASRHDIDLDQSDLLTVIREASRNCANGKKTSGILGWYPGVK